MTMMDMPPPLPTPRKRTTFKPLSLEADHEWVVIQDWLVAEIVKFMRHLPTCPAVLVGACTCGLESLIEGFVPKHISGKVKVAV